MTLPAWNDSFVDQAYIFYPEAIRVVVRISAHLEFDRSSSWSVYYSARVERDLFVPSLLVLPNRSYVRRAVVI